LSKTKRTILVVDDDVIFCESVMDHLNGANTEVVAVHNASECLDLCSRIKVDIALLDQKLPDQEGHKLCPSILGYNDQTKIIFTTAYPSFDNAVKAIRAGAYDYLSKPFELEELTLAVNQALRTLDLEKVEQLQNYKNDKEIEENVLVGGDKCLSEVKGLITLASTTEVPVLITGETGTGKNVVARAIHYSSMMARSAPFVSINCAAIPENLIEAELFGYDKGAFTGAVAARKGIFEMAEEGTLFLDEIGDMPFHLQSKLLGVLDDKKIKRIGGDSTRHINVRFIAATSLDLKEAIRNKKFRDDLYYRLNVIKIHIPPLRERRDDIPELCSYLVRRFGGERRITISDTEIERLKAYDWPGNVRELRNILERAIILQKGPEITPSALLCSPEPSQAVSGPGLSVSAFQGSGIKLNDMERAQIISALGQLSGNYTKTAQALGISLSTLKRKIKNYNIS
jgi:DNA-binding NtrC family response regulator